MSASLTLNLVNYLNVAAYIGNAVVTYGVGTMGIFGAKTNSELSEKYQTLVTPAGWAFSIWGIIFISELIFTVVQLLPNFRDVDIVQQGVKYNYVGVCLAQVFWTFLFSFQYVGLSLLAMWTILFFLVRIIAKSSPLVGGPQHYWLLKFPFLIHGGWIVAASLVNLNVVLVYFHVTSTTQLVVAIASLLAVVIAAGLSLHKGPEYVIPIVLVWATFGIWSELGAPKDLIVNTFSQGVIDIVRTGAIATSLLIAHMIGFAAFWQWRKSRNQGPVEEEGVYLRVDE